METIQEHYSRLGGIPKELIDLLVLSEVLETRVLLSYREHLQQSDVHPKVRETLERIIRDEEAHSGEQGWTEQLLAQLPEAEATAAWKKWRDIDQTVAATLQARLAEDFAEEGAHHEYGR
jgi:rubrerythrin